MHINQPPPKPSEFYPHIPPNLEEVVLMALEKNESDRFTSCEEFSESLLDEDWSRPEPYAEPEEEEDDFSSTNYDDDDDDLLDDEVQDAGWQTTSGEHETTEPFFDRAGVKSLSAIICGLIGMGIGAIPGGVAAIPGAIIGGLIGYAAPGLGIFLLVGIVIIVILFLFNT
jgi:serine/threonine protein kinase